jgi:hypothetical protein
MRPPPRKLNLLDAMILVAATAVGIAGTQHVWKRLGWLWFWNLDQGWGAWASLSRLLTVAALCLPALSAWTVAVLIIRLRQPRPALRQLALQPGAAACGAALLVIAAEAVGEFFSLAYFEFSKGYLGASLYTLGFTTLLYVYVLMRMPHPVSYAILSVWATLGVSRRGRFERSGIDRAGRIIGVCWVALALFFWVTQQFLNLRLPGALTR